MERRSVLLVIILVAIALGVAGGWLGVRPSAGRLEVTSVPPGASVFLDQKFVGTTPVDLKDVASGEHQIRLAYSGYRDAVKLVTVGWKSQTWNVTLEALPAAGTLVVQSEPPGAHVWLDGERRQQTPARIDSVAVGTHQLKVGRVGYTDEERTIEIRAGEVSTVSVRLVSERISYYRDYLVDHPDDATGHAELGRLYLLAGENDKAFAALLGGVKALVRTRQGADKGFRELTQGLQATDPDFPSEQWQEFVQSVTDMVDAGSDAYSACRPVCEVLSMLGRWEEMTRLCTSVISKIQGEATPFRLWRMEAATLRGQWKSVVADFDALRDKADYLDGWGRKYGLWNMPQEFMATDFAWCGALAKVRLDDLAGADEVIRGFRRNGPADYWLNSILAEQWLRNSRSQPPEQLLEAVRCDRGPVIDGNLGDDVWKQARPNSKFYARSLKLVSQMQTTVYSLCDAQNLYLGIDCKEPDPKRIDSGVRAGDMDTTYIWRDSALELFIDPDRDYTSYLQFIVNSNGAAVDLDCRTGLFTSLVLAEPIRNADYRVAVQVYPEGWRVEFAFPFKLFKAEALEPGRAWALNLIRCRSRHDETRCYLAPYSPKSHHQPKCFVPMVLR